MSAAAKLRGNRIQDTMVLHGSLHIGGSEPLPGLVPTPRFQDGNCFLPPRPQPYGIAEIALHDPERLPIEPRSFGPSCPCHGRRNMERMGYCLYRCQESLETFQMLVHDGHIAMVPLETGKALDDHR